MLRLKDAVEAITPSITPLPFIHTATGKIAADILQAGELKPQACKVFGVDLSYLYYGRPDYKPNFLPGQFANSMGKPVMFAINPTAISDCQVAPFDSGAYIDGRFEEVMGQMKPEKRSSEFSKKYELINGIDTPRKYVQFLYGENIHYYDGRAKLPFDAEKCIEAKECYDLATIVSAKAYDRRCTSIEIRTTETIPINSSTVEWVIIAEDTLPFLQDEFDRLGISEIYTYPPISILSMDEYSILVLARHRELLFMKGRMK